MTTALPESSTATPRDIRWLAHILACPHQKCRAARRCRLRWTSKTPCPARDRTPPDATETATLLARTNRELTRLAFENDDSARPAPPGPDEQRRRLAAAFERARKGT